MRRLTLVLAVVALLAAACGGDDSPFGGTTTAASETTATTAAPATTGTTAAPETTGTTPETATTAAPETTTTTAAPETTTTTAAPADPVTQHAQLPAAQPRSAVPWAAVDSTWALALMSTVPGYLNDNWVDPADYPDEPVVAYLVAPDGTPYEIAAWTASGAPGRVFDVRPDGKAAILGFPAGPRMLDVATGTVGPLPGGVSGVYATFTRPTGRDIVVLAAGGGVTMYRTDGSGSAELAPTGGTSSEMWYGLPTPPWIYDPEGMAAVVNGPGGISLVSNQGVFIRGLELPGMDCAALHWWDPKALVMRCGVPVPNRTEIFQLWLVDPTGGAQPIAMTTGDPAALPDMYEGYVDAHRAFGGAVVTGLVAAGSGWFPISKWSATGPNTPIGDPVAPAAGQIVAGGSNSLTVLQYGCCGEIWGALEIYDPQGNQISRLEANPDYYGVVDAHGVGT
jgi:hypothetical protein